MHFALISHPPKVELINGQATFKSPHELLVGNEVYTADHFLIAVGGEPTIPSKSCYWNTSNTSLKSN